MKKTFAIVGANLLIAGGLSARATWMIMSGCDIDGTCRGSSGLLTWGLAVGPAVLLLAVLGLSVPKILAGMSVRREERKVMKAERAEVAVQQSQEVEQGQSRLARLRKTAVDQAEQLEAEGMYDANALADSPDLLDDEFDDVVAIGHDADEQLDADSGYPETAVRGTMSADNGLPPADDEAAAIEREWLAAEAELDPSADRFMAEPIDGAVSADIPPAYASSQSFGSEAFPPFNPQEDEADFEYRIVPAVAPVDAADEQPTVFSTFDPAVEAAEELSVANEAPEDETAAWFIEPADTTNRALQVNGQSWRPDDSEGLPVTGSGNPKVDIWARTAFDIGADDEVDGTASAGVNHEPIGVEAADDGLPPIDLPLMGRAPDEWAWLFADGLPLLRTSRATGFPWIAGGIGEVATAIQSAVNLDDVGHFAAEAEAWVRIARSIPYAEPLPMDDAQAFVEWCNTLSVDLAASNQQVALCGAVADAMYALRGRAKNDMETSLALPDAFDSSVGGAFGTSLSA